MARIILLTAFFSLTFLFSTAQQDSLLRNTNDIFQKIEKGSDGRITFNQNDSIRNLVIKHIAYNKHKEGIPGYRIRIYSNLGTNARKRSQEIRTEFYDKFPDIPIYREYDSPYFKVYVGDFRTKIEAIKSLKKIKKYFPAAFVVPDQIELPEID